jgi:hypothetical protein
MNETGKIESWKSPVWHSDFGNPEMELSLLKKLCLFINSLNSDYHFELDCFEEGYMRVEISKENEALLEIYIVDVKEEKIGLFFKSGHEFYINKIEDVTKYLTHKTESVVKY